MNSCDPYAVADASVVINLNASGYAADILRAYPSRIIVPAVVQRELEAGRARGRKDADALRNLTACGLVEVRELGSKGQDVFGDLVVGPAASTLDDGEAATIACAIEGGCTAVIDDQKAIRICGEKFKELKVISTVAILRDDVVGGVLGQCKVAAAVFNALQIGRMRVLDKESDWVLAVIGQEQAKLCPSLGQIGRR